VQIVETIDGTGNQAERCKHHHRRPKEFRLQQLGAEEGRCEHESVLDPLQRAQELDVMLHLFWFDAAKVQTFLEYSKSLYLM